MIQSTHVFLIMCFHSYIPLMEHPNHGKFSAKSENKPQNNYTKTYIVIESTFYYYHDLT